MTPVSHTIAHDVGATRPWLVVVAVFFFLYAGFCALGGLASFAMFAFAAGSDNNPMGWMLVFMPVIYLAMGGVVGLLGVRLVQVHRHFGLVEQGGGSEALEDALAANRVFWKTAAMTLIGSVVIGVVMTIGMFAAMALLAPLPFNPG